MKKEKKSWRTKFEEFYCVLDHLGHHYRPTYSQWQEMKPSAREIFSPSCLFCGKRDNYEE